MSSTAIRRLIHAGIALALAIAIGFGAFRRDIDAPKAAAIADRMLIRYSVSSGMPVRHFGARQAAIWADGWEFRWAFLPCPEIASLRVWISRDGRRVRLSEVPDCAPVDGIGARARVV